MNNRPEMYLYPCAVYRAVYIIYLCSHSSVFGKFPNHQYYVHTTEHAVVFSFNMSLSPLEIVIAPNNVSSVSRDDASRIQA